MRIVILILLFISFNSQAQIVHSIFGQFDEQNPVAIELLNSAALQRLKGIDQSGPSIYFSKDYASFSRYDHSIGVYALLKRYNVTPKEQIAGLMHDTSHTVFSHLADSIMQTKENRIESYQDSIHDWFLTKSGVLSIINKYNLSLLDLSPKNPAYTALEQSFPDMNADRIEYNLHTALIFNDLNPSDIDQILNALHFQNDKWFFTDINQAKKFAKLSTYYTRNFWGSHDNTALYVITGTALKYAIDHDIVNLSDLHFGVDQDVVNILKNSKDPILKSLIKISNNITEHYIRGTPNDFHIHNPVKMRGIDPLVLQNGNLVRLSSLSIDYKQELQTTTELSKQGVYLKFINIDNPELLNIITKTLG